MIEPALLEKRPSLHLVKLDNILFTTDFSSSSLAALPYAAAVARRYGSKIFLAHAVQPHPYPLVSGEAITFMDELVQGARKEINELAGSELLKGIEHQALLGHGEITVVLEKFVRDHHIDLVITGTHGRRGFRRFILGSVAEEMFRTTQCPVLTVGPHVAHAAPETLSLHHVLYATRLAEESACACSFALSFALPCGALHRGVHHMQHGEPRPVFKGKR